MSHLVIMNSPSADSSEHCLSNLTKKRVQLPTNRRPPTMRQPPTSPILTDFLDLPEHNSLATKSYPMPSNHSQTQST